MKQTDELKYWIQLWRAPGVGSRHYQKLLAAFGSPRAVLNSSISALKQAGISDLVSQAIKNSEDMTQPDISWLESSSSHHIVTLECDAYPALLKQISDPPPLLYVHGNLAVLNDLQLAIVGSRNPTQGGKNTGYDFAKHLAQTGFCITSGLALGIDGIAHQGALDASAPTIAVIATGIDRVYPARHRDLAHQIVKKGAIVSEFPIGVQPKSENFPRRNRIISGMSYGTLVVEAALRSGSLITARCASEQGREVFAIPGSIHNPLARGCHQLIRQGAKLVETAQDILEEMAPILEVALIKIDKQDEEKKQHNFEQPDDHEKISLGKQKNGFDSENNAEKNLKTETQPGSGLDAEQNNLLEKMGYDPIPVDQLVIQTGYPAEQLSAMLLILELQDYVSTSGGGTYTRIK